MHIIIVIHATPMVTTAAVRCFYLNHEYFAEQMFFVPQILPHLELQTPSAPARILAARCTDHLVKLY